MHVGYTMVPEPTAIALVLVGLEAMCDVKPP